MTAHESCWPLSTSCWINAPAAWTRFTRVEHRCFLLAKRRLPHVYCGNPTNGCVISAMAGSKCLQPFRSIKSWVAETRHKAMQLTWG